MSSSFEGLFLVVLQDTHDAERRMASSLPRLIRAAHSVRLRQVLSTWRELAERHGNRLEHMLERAGLGIHDRSNRAMAALLAEGEDLLDLSPDASTRDVAVLAAAQRIDRYKTATYDVLRAWAQHVGRRDLISSLQTTLREQGAAQQALASVADSIHAEAVSASVQD